MKLYEYAIIYTPHPTKANLDAAEKPKAVLLSDVTRVLAASDREAQMIAARAIPESHIDRLDQIEVAVRPF